VSQVAFLFFSLLGQNVTLVSVFTLDFARSGKSESFLAPELVFTFGILFKNLIVIILDLRQPLVACRSFVVSLFG
jgi:hypothetical protein